MSELATVIDITQDSQALALKEEIGGVPSPVSVVDSETMILADERVKNATLAIKVIEEKLGPRRDAAFKLHRSLTSLIAEMSAPWKIDRDYHINQVKAYQRKLEEIRQAEERRLREEARKAEEERRLAEALEAEQNGSIEEAQAILEEEMFVPPPVVKVEAPRVDGRKYAVRPKARVINKMDVIKTVAMNPALIDLIDINMTVANQKAKSMGKDLGKAIKGLEYFEE